MKVFSQTSFGSWNLAPVENFADRARQALEIQTNHLMHIGVKFPIWTGEKRVVINKIHFSGAPEDFKQTTIPHLDVAPGEQIEPDMAQRHINLLHVGKAFAHYVRAIAVEKIKQDYDQKPPLIDPLKNVAILKYLKTEFGDEAANQWPSGAAYYAQLNPVEQKDLLVTIMMDSLYTPGLTDFLLQLFDLVVLEFLQKESKILCFDRCFMPREHPRDWTVKLEEIAANMGLDFDVLKYGLKYFLRSLFVAKDPDQGSFTQFDIVKVMINQRQTLSLQKIPGQKNGVVYQVELEDL